MRKRKPWKFIFILLFAVAISLGVYVYQQQYEPDDLFVKVGEGILDNAPEIFSGEPKEVQELRKQEVADTDTQGLRQEYYFSQLNEEEQRGYREIIEGIRAKEKEFYLTIYEDDTVNKVYHAVLMDHPELFWVHNRKQVYKTTFSNANYCMFSPGYSYTDEEIQAMDEKAKSEAWYKMWRNFCVSDSYEPGSPQKAFTVAGAIEEGAISGNEVFECGGKLHFGDWDIRCVARAGHGPLTITQGLMKSCNVVMMRIVSLEGKEKFVQYQKIFGFGEKTGIDLPGEASGLIYQASNMDPASLATNAFGQNYNCTMVQMAAGYASLINGGSYYEPHVVKEILNDEGSVVKSVSPNLVRETVSESTSNFINNALYQTVSGDGGTAGAAAVAGYEVAGKTGTAQKQPRAEKNYLVSFIGYAPAYNPQVLCYVVVDTPHLPGEQQAHSTFASEIFSKIMAEVLPYKNVFPAGGAAQDLETNLSGQEEGIISGTATEDPNAAETPAETTPAPEGGWANYDEEFIDSGDEYSYPDTMGNVQDESAAVGNGETAGTGRDTGTADNAGETAASQEAQAAGD